MEVAVGNEASLYTGSERRIEYVTLGIGMAAAAVTGPLWGWRVGLGVACGAALSWINYRWMKQGIDALAEIARPQQGAEKVRVPTTVYVKFIGRYALLIGAAYVMLSHFELPVASVLGGFFAVIAAVLAEIAGQLFRHHQIPDRNS
jgi:hypothetical protein